MSMKIRVIPLLALCSAVATFSLSSRAVEPTTTTTTTQTTVNALPAGAAPEFSGRIPDVVTLAKSGVDESVVIAFIHNSPGPFMPSAEEVIRLRDAGLTSREISAMLERGGELRAQAAAVASAQPYAQPSSEAPVITSEAPATSADYGTQPGTTVVYAGGDNGGYDYGYGYPYYGYPYYYGYPSAYFYGGWIGSPFFFPFPCWFNGSFFPHGCFFPHGGFVHGGFHGSFRDGSGFHAGIGASGFRGAGVSGFRGGAVSGFRGGSVSGFRGASVSGFRGGSVSGFRGGVVGGGFRGASVGGFRGGAIGGGFHGAMGGGGFHGGMGGGFHGGGGGGHR